MDSGSNFFLGYNFKEDAPQAIDKMIEFLDRVLILKRNRISIIIKVKEGEMSKAVKELSFNDDWDDKDFAFYAIETTF